MNRVELDLIDKSQDRYIIRYYDNTQKLYKALVLPINIYNKYKSSSVGDNPIVYKMKRQYDSDYINIVITKIKSLNYNDRNSYMKIEFSDSVLYIPDSKFIKIAKTYCFQTFVDIKLINGNGQVNYHNYRFLKNYDTRSKAIYFMDKFACRFPMFYKKWFIRDEVVYDIMDEALEIFNGSILYEHEYIFKCRDGNGTAVYTFTILSIEKG